MIDAHFEDMTLEQLERTVVWLSIAINRAKLPGTMDDILETLVSWYDEAFIAYISLDDSGELKDWVLNGQFQPPTGWEDRSKYRELAERYSES